MYSISNPLRTNLQESLPEGCAQFLKFQPVERLNFLERVYDDDRKLDADFERNDINVFKKNIESIQKIFDEEMNIYTDRTKAKPSELLSIDEIEKVYSKFVKLSFAIFVSDSGFFANSTNCAFSS